DLAVQNSDPWTAVWHTSFNQPTTLTFASHIFPGWQARLDGEALAVAADEEGRLQVSVPAGRHTLAIFFGRTPVRWLADGLSVAGLLVCLWLVLKRKELIFTAEAAEHAENMKTPHPLRSLRLISLWAAGLAILLLLGK